MKILTNEWQLDCQLNKSLQTQHRGDFALYLALLSSSADEFAAFFTPDAEQPCIQKNLYTELSVTKARPFAQSEQDIKLMNMHRCALEQGMPQLKLSCYLAPPPWVAEDNAKKLSTEVWQNLDAHSKRRLQQQPLTKPAADPAALYDVLQQLHQQPVAA